jgi:hypothetical protein
MQLKPHPSQNLSLREIGLRVNARSRMSPKSASHCNRRSFAGKLEEGW